MKKTFCRTALVPSLIMAASAAALTGMILYWKRQYLTSDVAVTLALTTGAVMASAFLSDIFWAMIKKRSVSLNGVPSQNVSIRRAVISAASATGRHSRPRSSRVIGAAATTS